MRTFFAKKRGKKIMMFGNELERTVLQFLFFSANYLLILFFG